MLHKYQKESLTGLNKQIHFTCNHSTKHQRISSKFVVKLPDRKMQHTATTTSCLRMEAIFRTMKTFSLVSWT